MPESFKHTPVYYSADPKDSWKNGWKPYRELVANTPEELEGLLRIGWKTEKPEEAK